MAGSRLEKFGTVFTRVRDLMRSGVIKESEKPIWYDVYQAFPPKREPLYVRPLTRTKKQDTVPEIFYREDRVRAMFYEQYGQGPQAFELSRSNFSSLCQRFVDKFTELQRNSELSDTALFEETGKALLAEGVVLRRRGAPPVAAKPSEPLQGLKLKDLWEEADGRETAEQAAHTDTPTP